MYTFRHALNENDINNSLELRYRVYCKEKGWVDPALHGDFLEKDRFDSHSYHYLAFDSKEQLVGTARLIMHSESEGIQISAHPGLAGFDDFENCAEISRLMTIPDHRKGSIVLGLIRMIYVDIINELNYLRYLYIAVEKPFHRVLRMLGFDFVKEGKLGYFYGDELVAARMNVAEMDDHVRQHNFTFYNWLYEDPAKMEEKDTIYKFISDERKRRSMGRVKNIENRKDFVNNGDLASA